MRNKKVTECLDLRKQLRTAERQVSKVSKKLGAAVRNLPTNARAEYYTLARQQEDQDDINKTVSEDNS